jgi:hypothetical protein
MRQGDDIEPSAGARDAEPATDHTVQFLNRNELCDRQFADRDDEPWLQDLDLAIKP